MATMTGRKSPPSRCRSPRSRSGTTSARSSSRFDSATLDLRPRRLRLHEGANRRAFEQRRRRGPHAARADAKPRVSPDGKWEALVTNYNVASASRAPGRQRC